MAATTPERPNRTWLLAIDSSTELAGVALFDGERCAELSWPAGREQTTTLLAQIDHLLMLNGVALTDLAVVAVATGPGMFNGLRVGVGVAKGFVLGLGVPLVGVSTLDVTAHPYAPFGRPVLAVVAAGRGRLVWAVYGHHDRAWRPTTAPRNGSVDELATHVRGLTDGAIVAGELTPEQEALIRTVPHAIVPPRPLRSRRPAALADLTWHRFRAGASDEPATLEPVYVHAPATPS
jgi:tRNA threonylcarbamoyladenosine biosynthesis protein TsaB